MKRADSNVISAQAIKEGFKTLKEDGIEKIAQGITTVEEITKLF